MFKKRLKSSKKLLKWPKYYINRQNTPKYTQNALKNAFKNTLTAKNTLWNAQETCVLKN